MELPGWCGVWLAPSPSPLGPKVPDRHDEHGVGTFIWPPVGTSTWPPVGTFSWPRTTKVPLPSVNAVQGHLVCAIRDSNPGPAVKAATIQMGALASITGLLSWVFGESSDHRCPRESTRIRLKVMSKRRTPSTCSGSTCVSHSHPSSKRTAMAFRLHPILM